MKKTILTLATAMLMLPAAAFAQTAPATAPAPAAATVPATTTAPAATTRRHGRTKAAAPAAVPGKVVNVNSASAADLITIPGINAKIAADVIKNRPYKNSAELVKKVKGIGPKNVLKMLPYMSF